MTRNRHARQPLSVCKTQLFLNAPLKKCEKPLTFDFVVCILTTVSQGA